MIRHAALLLLAGLVAGCPDDPKKRKIGATCDEDADCESGLCYEKRCFDPVADSDDDTLLNDFEIDLGIDPEAADTDLDGKRDPDELGPDQSIVDTDGDGRIDALESALLDADGDCIVDELDPDDANADPDGCATTVYGSCTEAFEGGETSGAFTIDPDGDGTQPPMVVQCSDFGGGGWTRLTASWATWLAQATPVAHEYLLVANDTFILTPPSETAWSWTSAQNASGAWFFKTAAGVLKSFDCGPGGTGGAGAGLGCFDPQEIVSVDPATENASPSTGDLDVCITGVPELAGCVHYQVFERPIICTPDEGSIIGDGDFGDGDSSRCWHVETLDQGGAGLQGNVDTDQGEGNPAPSMRADPYLVNGAWYANLMQKRLHLATGHAYRWQFDAKASEARPFIVDATAEDLSQDIGVGQMNLTTDWQTFEFPITSPGAALFGYLRFFFGYDGAGVVYLDNVKVLDAGPFACQTVPAELVGNGGFESGLACWDSVIAEATPWTSLGSDGVGNSAYVTVSSADGDIHSNLLSKDELNIVAGHVYEARMSIRGTGEYRADLSVSGGDSSGFAFFSGHVNDAWTTYTERFAVDTVGTTPWVLALVVQNATDGRCDVDDVGVVDLGTVAEVCASNPDVGFELGLACWNSVGTVVPDPDEARDEESKPSVRLDNPGATAPSDVTLFRAITLRASTAYNVALWAKAGEPQPITVRITFGADSTTLFSQDFTLTNEWQAYGDSFGTSPGGTIDAVLEVNSGQSLANEVWIDDLIVEEQTR